MSTRYTITQLAYGHIREVPSLTGRHTGKIRDEGEVWESTERVKDGPRYWFRDRLGWTSSGTDYRYMKVVTNETSVTSNPTPTEPPNSEAEIGNGDNSTDTTEDSALDFSFSRNQIVVKDIDLASTSEYESAKSNIDNTTGIISDRSTLIKNKREKFIITPYIDLYDKVRQTKELVFFTKPDLNILDSNNQLLPALKGQTEFVDAYDKNPEIFKYLTHTGSNTGPFIPLLTNTLRNTLDLPDIIMETKETVKNVFGTSITYRTNSETSDEKHKFSLEFEDSKYGELYTLFDIWDKYSTLTNLGIIDPRESYIFDGIVDDQITIFKIILGEDLRSIIKIFELIGCFPENVPRSSYSELKPGSLIYNISWFSQFILRSEIEAVHDFNKLVNKSSIGTNVRPPYTGESLVFTKPFIIIKNVYNKKKYSLEWE